MSPRPATARRPLPRSPLPETFRPQLASLVKAPPQGEVWLHEVKFDGYRIGCRIDRGEVSLISRRENDWTASFPEVRDAARRLPVTQALLDGEVAILLPDGRTRFQALQNAFGGGSRRGLVYFVFDLLHLDGVDVSRFPLEERKAALKRLLASVEDQGVLRYSEHVTGAGADVFREACRLGTEGVVSKRRDQPYQPGRNNGWLKTKCVRRQELVIGGFTDPEGSRVGIGAVLVGYYDDAGKLRFAGKVGTGFTQQLSKQMRHRLEPLEQKRPPFADPPPGWLGNNAHWVRPELVGEVAFTEWTEGGHIRHPSFQGMREDKRPEGIVREEPLPTSEAVPALAARVKVAERPRRRRRASGVEVAGVPLSHPDRVVYPELGLTKLQVAKFYEGIAEWILPHVQGRPLTLVRCPREVGDECHYMKHSKVWAPEAVRRVRIPEKTKLGEYLVIDSLAALISIVQMDVLELHTWNSKVEHVEQPDRIVIDLDPGPEVPWSEVVEAARLVRSALEALRLKSFVKTTGGSGLHVVVPLVPQLDWSECLAFSRALAQAIERQRPALYTTSMPKAGRERKIFLDYLRNNRTNTSVAAFSTRARPHAPVSVPLSWDELSAKVRSDHYTVQNLPRRLKGLRTDPWKPYWTAPQRITKEALAALAAL